MLNFLYLLNYLPDLILHFYQFFLLSPDKTFPGPISIKLFVPKSIILFTLSLHLTGFSICSINNFFISSDLFTGFAVTFEIISYYWIFKFCIIIFFSFHLLHFSLMDNEMEHLQEV